MRPALPPTRRCAVALLVALAAPAAAAPARPAASARPSTDYAAVSRALTGDRRSRAAGRAGRRAALGPGGGRRTRRTSPPSSWRSRRSPGWRIAGTASATSPSSSPARRCPGSAWRAPTWPGAPGTRRRRPSPPLCSATRAAGWRCGCGRSCWSCGASRTRPRADYQAVLKADPRNPEAHFGLARLARARGDLEEAHAQAAAALEGARTIPGAWAILGQIAEEIGEPGRRSTSGAAPSSRRRATAGARVALARLLTAQGDARGAQEQWQAALEIKEDPESLAALADAARAAGDAEAEQKAVERLSRLTPSPEQWRAWPRSAWRPATSMAPSGPTSGCSTPRPATRRRTWAWAGSTWPAATASRRSRRCAPPVRPGGRTCSPLERRLNLEKLSRPDVNALQRAVQVQVDRTYRARLAEAPSLSGNLRVRVTVDGDGAATQVEVLEDSVHDERRPGLRLLEPARCHLPAGEPRPLHSSRSRSEVSRRRPAERAGPLRARRAGRAALRAAAREAGRAGLQSDRGDARGWSTPPTCSHAAPGVEPGAAARPRARGPRRRAVHGARWRASAATRAPGCRWRRSTAPTADSLRPAPAPAGGARRAGLRHPGRRDPLLHLPGHHDALHGGGRGGADGLRGARPAQPAGRRAGGGAAGSARVRELLRAARPGGAPRHDRGGAGRGCSGRSGGSSVELTVIECQGLAARAWASARPGCPGCSRRPTCPRRRRRWSTRGCACSRGPTSPRGAGPPARSS